MINLPFFKVLNLDIPTHIKYWIIKNKQIPKHLLEIIDQVPPITLENTLALPLENFKILGKTEQKQLTGKNLLEGMELGDINSNTGIPTSSSAYVRTKNYIPYSSSLFYRISINNEVPTTGTYNLRFYNSNKEYIGYGAFPRVGGDNFTVTVVTSVEDTNPAYFKLRTGSGNINLDNDEVMITTSEDLMFEPYCGGQPSPNLEFPQPINNVSGDITISVSDENNTNSQEVVFPLVEGQKLMEGDYLAEDGIHHVKGQILLDGTEASWRADNNNTLFGVSLPNAKDNRSTSAIPYGYCNRAIIGTLNNARTHEYNFNIYGSYGSVMCWFNDRDVTLNEFKTWLSNHNLLVEYELNEETLEPYTEAQASKFEEIKSLTGYNNITIVDVTSSNLKPNVSLKYYAKGWR